MDRPYRDRDHAGKLYRSPAEAYALCKPFHTGHQLSASTPSVPGESSPSSRPTSGCPGKPGLRPGPAAPDRPLRVPRPDYSGGAGGTPGPGPARATRLRVDRRPIP
ncbi:MAG: hypothetical protein MZU95_15765 [Desulfomicrobium escambiense]|nr:hypothetical protein [Desulfomicrobium escambiense]